MIRLLLGITSGFFPTTPVFQQGGLDQRSETGMRIRVGKMAKSLLRHHAVVFNDNFGEHFQQIHMFGARKTCLVASPPIAIVCLHSAGSLV